MNNEMGASLLVSYIKPSDVMRNIEETDDFLSARLHVETIALRKKLNKVHDFVLDQTIEFASRFGKEAMVISLTKDAYQTLCYEVNFNPSPYWGSDGPLVKSLMGIPIVVNPFQYQPIVVLGGNEFLGESLYEK